METTTTPGEKSVNSGSNPTIMEVLTELHGKKYHTVKEREFAKIQQLNEVTDPVVLKQITNNVLVNTPKTVKLGSVGELLYVCAKNNHENEGMYTPECFKGGYLPNSNSKPDKHVYERTINGLVRLYQHPESSQAYVFIISSESPEITQLEKDKLRDDGVDRAVVYNRNSGNIRYVKSKQIEVKKSWEDLESNDADSSKYTCSAETESFSVDSTCEPKKDKNQNGWVFWLLILLIVIILALLFIGFFYNAYSTTSASVQYPSHKTPSCPSNNVEHKTYALSEENFYSSVSAY